MSIKNLFEKWASVNINIFVDITNFISNLSKYNNYFDDIDETGQWYNGIVNIIKDTHNYTVPEIMSHRINLHNTN